MRPEFLKSVADQEMDAFDELPPCVRAVFQECPRKVSVIQTMALPGVKKAYRSMAPQAFATVLTRHLAAQSRNEALVSS